MKDESKTKAQLINELAELRQRVADMQGRLRLLEIVEAERVQTEEVLRQSELRFRSLIEQTTDAVFCYECDPPIPTSLPIEEQVKQLYRCVLVECNDVCARSYGFTRAEQVMGKKLTELFGTTSGSLDELFTALIQSDYRIVDRLGTEVLEGGTKRYYSNNRYGVVEDGMLKRVWATFRDITGRVRAEEALRKSEAKYYDLYDLAPDMLVSVDVKTATIIECNQTLLTATGYTKEEIIGRSIFDMYAPESAQYAREIAFPMFAETGIAEGEELQLLRKDGSTIDVSLRVSAARDAQGNILYSRSSWRDITERKRVDEALRESEERYRQSVESSPNPMFSVDREGIIQTWNQACEQTFQHRAEEIIGQSYHKLLWSPEDHTTVEAALTYVWQGHSQSSQDITYRCKDGTQRLTVSRLYPLRDREGSVQGCVFANTDITERVRAEEALRESEAKLQSIFRAAPTGIGLVSDRVFLQVNDRICEMVGYTSDELIGKSARVLYPTDEDYEFVGREKYRQINKFGTGTVETRWQRKDGEIIDVLLSSTPLNPADLSAGVTFTALDITERARTEKALRESEERFRHATLDAPFPIMIHAEDGEIVQINKVWTELTGYAPDEIPTIADWTERAYGKRKELVRADIDRLYDLDTRIYGGEYTVTISTGEPRRWDFSSVPLGRMPDGRRLVLSMAMDITERVQAEEALQAHSERLEAMVEERTRELREAQEQLVRQEKLAVLGQLAGGVGHELRNPLGVISNAVYYLQMVLGDAEVPAAGETIKEYLEIISSQVRGAVKIVSDLLDFSRTQLAEREEVAVSDLIARTLEKHPAPEAVQVTVDVAPALPALFVDPKQIEQVLANLVTNAYQAMTSSSPRPEGSAEMPDEGEMTIRAQAVGDQVRISITDTGHGISDEDMPKLFEPLFTTKPRGIGLGLTISKTLVEANEGSVEVQSRVGQGSTFTVILPVSGE